MRVKQLNTKQTILFVVFCIFGKDKYTVAFAFIFLRMTSDRVSSMQAASRDVICAHAEIV